LFNDPIFETFKPFDKISRLFEQPICVTEKIDGTNAVVVISADCTEIRAGSRTRWISPEDDNYGFAKWVEANKEDLKLLGPGYHFGEWWGQGIQRGYGMTKKVFSLFNVNRWDNESRPACCDVVPTVFKGKDWPEDPIHKKLPHSLAAAKYGVTFEATEGLVYWFANAKMYFKVIWDK